MAAVVSEGRMLWAAIILREARDGEMGSSDRQKTRNQTAGIRRGAAKNAEAKTIKRPKVSELKTSSRF